MILSSTKLAISKCIPILGVEEARRSAKRDRRAARSPKIKTWTVWKWLETQTQIDTFDPVQSL